MNNAKERKLNGEKKCNETKMSKQNKCWHKKSFSVITYAFTSLPKTNYALPLLLVAIIVVLSFSVLQKEKEEGKWRC